MHFFFEKMPGVAFTSATRRARLGGAVSWELRGDMVQACLEELGRLWQEQGVALGSIRTSDKLVLSARTAGVVLTAAERIGPREIVVRATETAVGPESNVPRRRVWVRGEEEQADFVQKVIREAHGHASATLDAFVDKHLGTRVPYLLQDGLTDLEFLASLAEALTRDTFLHLERPPADPHVILLSGLDGSANNDGWQLEAFPKVDTSQPLPGWKWRTERWERFTPGRFASLAPGAGPVLVCRATGKLEGEGWPRLRDSLALPGPSPFGWVVAGCEELHHDGRHVRWQWIAPKIETLLRPASGWSAPRSLFRARVGAYDQQRWSIPCHIAGFEGPPLPALLSTPHAGADGTSGGVHFVPAAGSTGLVYIPQRLGEPAVLLTVLRSGEDGATPGVREHGDACLLLPGDFYLAAGKKVGLQGHEQILLQAEGGRMLKVGPEYVDID